MSASRSASTISPIRRAPSWRKPNAAGCSIVLPTDGVVAREFKANADNETVAVSAIPADAMMLDIGPQSIEAVNGWISKANTLVWNGPLGAFEIQPFDTATMSAAKFAAEETRAGKLVSVAGGGDTVAALNACRRDGRLYLCLHRRRRLP